MPFSVKSFLLKSLKAGFKIYAVIAFFIGTGVLVYPFILLLHNHYAPAPLPVYLPNGFIYDSDRDRRRGIPHAIYNSNNQKIILSDVKNIMWHENTVYGFRRGLAKEPYYFICTYDEDCSKTQHLSEVDFIAVLAAKNLPAYDRHIAQSYYELLEKQSKTDTGKKGG